MKHTRRLRAHALPWYRRPFAAIRNLFSPDTQVVNDGWENEVTGLGTHQRDKAMNAHFERQPPIALNWPLCDAVYHDDDISGRIIDLPVTHMFRKGWETHIKGDKSGEQAKEFRKEAHRLGVHKKFKEATTWADLYGGCLIIVGYDDDRPLDEPLDEENIKSIKYLNVVDRRYVITRSWYTDPFNQKLSEPESYYVYNSQIGPYTDVLNIPGAKSSGAPEETKLTPKEIGTNNTQSNFIIHESRCIRFEGANTSKIERFKLGGWTHSRLQRPYEKIKAFAQAFLASGNLINDAAQGVYKLQGLLSQVGSNEVDAITTRMMLLDFTRSVARAIALDETEEFERQVAALTGYPEMLDRFMMLLSAATEIPVTLLMGRSAAGMNSTGDSDFRQFYDVIEGRQTHELKPNLHHLYRLLSLAKDGPSKGEEAEFQFSFKSLWSPTLMEQAQINLAQSTADSNNIASGMVTAEEAAISRFGHENGELNLNTVIDVEGRQAAQEAAKTFDGHENDPTPKPGDLAPDGKSIIPDPNAAQADAGKDTGANKGKNRAPNSSQPGFKPNSGR